MRCECFAIHVPRGTTLTTLATILTHKILPTNISYDERARVVYFPRDRQRSAQHAWQHMALCQDTGVIASLLTEYDPTTHDEECGNASRGNEERGMRRRMETRARNGVKWNEMERNGEPNATRRGAANCESICSEMNREVGPHRVSWTALIRMALGRCYRILMLTHRC